MCERMDNLEKKVDKLVNIFNELNNKIINLQENSVDIKAIQPILDELKNLHNKNISKEDLIKVIKDSLKTPSTDNKSIKEPSKDKKPIDWNKYGITSTTHKSISDPDFYQTISIASHIRYRDPFTGEYWIIL